MLELTLLRHTKPKIERGMCYGRLDIDVQPTFEVEAQAVAARLKPPYQIISSPLRRCQILAAFVASTFNCHYLVDERLTEMDFGRWEGLCWDVIPRSELDDWASDFLYAAPHGGESVQALNERVAARLEQDRLSGQPTLWVTHAGVIKSARYLLSDDRAEFDWQSTIQFGHAVKAG